MKKNSFDIISERILDIMAQGTVPWHKPWKFNGGTNPINIISGKEYKGANRLLLSCTPYESNIFMTYKQAQKQGGSVVKGSKGWPVVYWKFLEKTKNNADGTTTKQSIPMLRHYTVFNVEQTEGVKVPTKFTPTETDVEEVTIEPIACAEAIIDNWHDKPAIKITNTNKACYYPSRDMIQAPELSQYDIPAEYYCVLFHESVHATGHATRLNRTTLNSSASFGSEIYSREELVAEIGAAMLCGHCAIENHTIENSAAYIKGWMKHIKKDPKCFVIAAGQAEKAAKHILNITDKD